MPNRPAAEPTPNGDSTLSTLSSLGGSTCRGEWRPDAATLAASNVAWLMAEAGVADYPALHAWSVRDRAAYWDTAIRRLGIRFATPYRQVMDLSAGVEHPRWCVGGRLNIVDSCFQAPADSPAILHQLPGGPLQSLTVGELDAHSRRVAAGLSALGLVPGDAVAIILPMHAESVAIYLGVLRAGCVAVGIPESFRPKEIANRLRLADAKLVVTQDVQHRAGKALPLYAVVREATPPRCIVLPAPVALDATSAAAPSPAAPDLQPGDLTWDAFLAASPSSPSSSDSASPSLSPAAPLAPDAPMTILFSSGTTGEPKAIPWTHSTPIKCAADAHFHHDIHPGDRLAWPTSLGWMMGPWLIFAALLNRATICLYGDAPTGPGFGRFVQDAAVTMLGVVPSLVHAWRSADGFDGVDWRAIRLYSSTGECSNAADMAWLMDLAGGRPVIEYCGGTEIGGGYLTGTIALPCRAGTFNTPALGLDLLLLDPDGHPADAGEVYLLPPSMGLSTALLNADHHAIYYANTPTGPDGALLRRHGDHLQRLPDGSWRARGRVDDTMNLGGIKVSSAELEAALVHVPGVRDVAAIAIHPELDGPDALLICLVAAPDAPCTTPEDWRKALQAAIRAELNPLFKIHRVELLDTLPRTASNKVMRRVLRDRFSPV